MKIRSPLLKYRNNVNFFYKYLHFHCMELASVNPMSCDFEQKCTFMIKSYVGVYQGSTKMCCAKTITLDSNCVVQNQIHETDLDEDLNKKLEHS